MNPYPFCCLPGFDLPDDIDWSEKFNPLGSDLNIEKNLFDKAVNLADGILSEGQKSLLKKF